MDTDVITEYQIQAFQQRERTVTVSSNYTVRYSDDYILANTTAGVITVTLPAPRNGKTFTVIRIAGTNNVVITALGGALINGGASLTISNSYVPKRLKAFAGVGYVEV